MRTWSEAFAEQATSDLFAYEHLARSALPVCHRLHYLQMWLEKLCKAHLYSDDPELRFTHSIVRKILPRLVLEHWRRIHFEASGIYQQVQDLCREIDLLHPQVNDGGRRPDNVEYRWVASSGTIEFPAQWQFRLVGRLESHPGRELLKAAKALTRVP